MFRVVLVLFPIWYEQQNKSKKKTTEIKSPALYTEKYVLKSWQAANKQSLCGLTGEAVFFPVGLDG